MSTERPLVFIASYRSYQAITKTIYDYLLKQGFDVLYHFSDDIQVDYTATIEAHIIASDVVITIITPEGFQINQATNHYKLMLNTAIEHQRAIIPLMFFEDTWEAPLIQEHLPDDWQSLTQYEPIHLNFANFDSSLQSIETRLQTIDISSVGIQVATEKMLLSPIELDDVESALKAEEVYGRGGRAFLDDNYEEAEKCLTEAISLNPNFADAYNNRALVYKNLGNLELALKDIRVASELVDNALHFTNLAHILIEMNDNDSALEASNKAIEIDIQCSAAYHNRGHAYSNLGDDAQAIKEYTKSVEINPQNHIGFNNRGVCLEDLGQFEDALEDFNQAIYLKLKEVYLHNRASLYKKLGKLEKALEDYKQILELNLGSVDTLIDISDAYQKIHQYDVALTFINQAIELDSSNPVLYCNRGAIYLRQEDFHKALECLDNAIALDSSFASAYVGRAQILLIGHNKQTRALGDYHQAILLEPENASYYSLRAGLYRIMKDDSQALKDLNKALELSPTPYDYLSRGIINMNTNHLDLARQDFENTLELDPKNKQADEFLDKLDEMEANPPNGCWSIFSGFGLF